MRLFWPVALATTVLRRAGLKQASLRGGVNPFDAFASAETPCNCACCAPSESTGGCVEQKVFYPPFDQVECATDCLSRSSRSVGPAAVFCPSECEVRTGTTAAAKATCFPALPTAESVGLTTPAPAWADLLPEEQAAGAMQAMSMAVTTRACALDGYLAVDKDVVVHVVEVVRHNDENLAWCYIDGQKDKAGFLPLDGLLALSDEALEERRAAASKAQEVQKYIDTKLAEGKATQAKLDADADAADDHAAIAAAHALSTRKLVESDFPPYPTLMPG